MVIGLNVSYLFIDIVVVVATVGSANIVFTTIITLVLAIDVVDKIQ